MFVSLRDAAISLSDGSKRVITKDGNLIAPAVISRAGNVQVYSRGELGLPGDPNAPFRLYRPASEVFAQDSLESLSKMPITIGHPKAPVTASNWKELAHGENDAAIADTEANAVTTRVTVRSLKARDAINNGTKYFSVGYTTDIDTTPGTSPSGEVYDGSMRNIRGQHLALVDTPRAGLSCKVSDSTTRANGVKMAVVIVDSFPIEIDDKFEQSLKGLVKQRDESKAIADGVTRERDALKIESATLQKQVADQAARIAVLEDKASPQAIELRARERSKLIADATKLCPKLVSDGKSDSDIRREVIGILAADGVTKKVLDAVAHGKSVASLNDEMLTIAFDAVASVASEKVAPAKSIEHRHADKAIGDSLTNDSGEAPAIGSWTATTTLRAGEFAKDGK